MNDKFLALTIFEIFLSYMFLYVIFASNSKFSLKKHLILFPSILLGIYCILGFIFGHLKIIVQ
jgi:hypothetical protein